MPHIPNQELTTRQKQALLFYEKHLEKHGVAPTTQQLADYLGIAKSATWYLLQKIKEKGFLRAASVEKITRTRLTLSAKGRKATG